ncbi:MAG: NAD(P)/FAD-dependent oxidoreductase [Actinomycetota bacterium]|nr:NAD(P)/FAD-dependent oxidoreductase [Actinomycetota bacterium]
MSSATGQTQQRRPHVVVIGGGFAGLQTVRSLKRADVDVTLVDRHVYNTFQPLLYQVATAALNAGDITYFLRSARARQDNLRFRKGAVTAVDPQRRTVTLDSGDTVSYDYLVIGTGVTTNWFGVPGAAENAMAMYTRKQALVVRDRLFTVVEEAAAQGQPRDLRFVVVGGGATGVEMAGALAEMRNNAMARTYPELERDRVHITLVEMGPHVLAPFAPKLRDYAARELGKRDVDLRLSTSVSEVRPDAVVVDDDEVVPADMVVWATGVTAHEVVSTWGLPQGRGGRILVEEDLRVHGFDEVFALGDIAVSADKPLAQLAQPAIQGGKHAAKQIRRLVAGEPTMAFRYRDKGTMATIGSRAAVAEITHFPKLKGFLAWVIWLFIHVIGLLGSRNRLATSVNLAVRYLSWPRTFNAIVGEVEVPTPRVQDRARQST